MHITAAERGQAIQRAQQALQHLHEHERTSRNRLGAARDQLNLVYRLSDPSEVWDCVWALESSVLDVYGAVPDQR